VVHGDWRSCVSSNGVSQTLDRRSEEIFPATGNNPELVKFQRFSRISGVSTAHQTLLWVFGLANNGVDSVVLVSQATSTRHERKPTQQVYRSVEGRGTSHC